jgi:peptidoglycan/LPS O-acetylase OafA/YrhL
VLEAFIVAKEDASRAFADYWSAGYFPFLDGIRAICVAAVIYFHLPETKPSWVVGELGVDVFFVLSGFLITTLLLREHQKFGSISLKGFYVRRAFRILPVYLGVLLLYVPVIRLSHDWQRWKEFLIALPYFLTFTQEYRPDAAGNLYGQTWSLGCEEKFYLVWPLFALILLSMRRRRWMALTAAGMAVLLMPPPTARAYGALLFGAVLGVLLDRTCRNRFQLEFFRIPTWVACLLVALTYALHITGHLSFLGFSAAVTLLVGTLVLRQSILRRLLGMRWMVILGQRSYAMYLLHALALAATVKVLQRLHLDTWYIALLSTFAASYLGAVVLYHLVEKPCMEYGRAISRRLREKLSSKPVPVRPIHMQTLESPAEQ